MKLILAVLGVSCYDWVHIIPKYEDSIERGYIAIHLIYNIIWMAITYINLPIRYFGITFASINLKKLHVRLATEKMVLGVYWYFFTSFKPKRSKTSIFLFAIIIKGKLILEAVLESSYNKNVRSQNKILFMWALFCGYFIFMPKVTHI